MITLPQDTGRELLRNQQEMLPSPERFTLRELVDVMERLTKTHGVERTDRYFYFICRNQRRGWKKLLVVALSWQMRSEDDPFDAACIYIELTIPCGVWSSFYSNESFSSEQFEDPQVDIFFLWLRYLRHFRWLGDRRPLKTKIELNTFGPEEFFEVAKKLIPKLIENGLWKCDGPNCPIGHAPTQGIEKT